MALLMVLLTVHRSMLLCKKLLQMVLDMKNIQKQGLFSSFNDGRRKKREICCVPILVHMFICHV
jgi:hypothetical protein